MRASYEAKREEREKMTSKEKNSEKMSQMNRNNKKKTKEKGGRRIVWKRR